MNIIKREDDQNSQLGYKEITLSKFAENVPELKDLTSFEKLIQSANYDVFKDIYSSRTDVLNKVNNRFSKVEMAHYRQKANRINCISKKTDKKELDAFMHTFIKNKRNHNSSLETIFKPNKASQTVLSSTGTDFDITALILNIINPVPDPLIYLVEKGGLIRNYGVTIIIDPSISCFSELNGAHTLQTIQSLLSVFTILDLPSFDLIIAGSPTPNILCSGVSTFGALNNKSPVWESLFAFLQNNERNVDLASAIHAALDLRRIKSADYSSILFVITDGLYQENEHKRILEQVNSCVQIGINTIGIGVGIYPKGITNLFPQVVYSPNPSLLFNGIASIFGDDIIEKLDQVLLIQNSIPKSDTLNEIFKDIISNQDKPTFSDLKNELHEIPPALDAFSDFYNEEQDVGNADKGFVNPTEKNTQMYVKDFLKGQKILIVMLWSNELSPKEREFVNRKYIFQSSEKGYSECIKTAVDHFGIELVVVINYYDAIIELTKQTKPGYCDYYAVWVFCGPPYCILPKQDNPHADPNLVGQFNEVLIQYWQNGGSIVFWAEGDPLHYQVNLFLETAKFYELGNKCVEFRVGGEHIGKKILLGDETGKLSKNQTFNRSPQFFNKITRTSLAHNIGKIFEGITISFVESTGNITPFQPFSRDSDGGISSLYYPSNTSIGNGDIIIDCGYTKCFTEIRTDGTFRYIQNIAGWTARPEVHIRTNPGIKPNEWRPKAVYYNIQLGVKWNKFEKGYFGSFDIIYMVDATGSMGDYITAAKNECINISNELKVKLPNVDFQFGGIFYRDPVDSSSDVHQYFNLSYDVVGLQRQIGTVKADGGGDGPEDWVGAYTIALNNIRWRDGIKLIIHIADAPAHGKAYGGDTKHQVEEAKLKPLVQRCAQRGIKIIGMYINNYALPSYNQCQTEYNTMSNPDMMYKIQEFRAGSDISAYFKEAVVTAAIAAAAKE